VTKPCTYTCTRREAKTSAVHHSFTADPALHTQALTCMRNRSTTQSNPCCPSAFIVLSPQRLRPAVTADPGQMPGGQYVQLLPPPSTRRAARTPAQWRCNCATHGGPHHSAYVEGAVECAAEANQDDHQQQTVSFAKPVPRPVLKAPLEDGDEAARQHP
jgi:hypothetical protein